MRVDFDNLECLSAFDFASEEPVSLRTLANSEDFDSDIRVIELKDVLYLPSVLERGQSICVANNRIVPAESVLDPWSVTFLKDLIRKDPKFGIKYRIDFNADRFEAPVCILGNMFSRNFGHWTEELLKVALLERANVACYYVISDLPSFARNFLIFLGVEECRILSVDGATIFAHALFTTAISHENLSLHPCALFALRDLVNARLGQGSSKYGARLWLERGEMVRNGGITTNREAVYECIGKYDFQVVDMATLSVSDQLGAIREANVIAGPHGAQFVHAQFMKSASTVLECFSPIHVNPSILQICRVMRHSYHQIVSRSHVLWPYTHGRDCEVDVEHLRLVLDLLRG